MTTLFTLTAQPLLYLFPQQQSLEGTWMQPVTRDKDRGKTKQEKKPNSKTNTKSHP